MLRKIKPGEVTLGMFVSGFEGSWLDHPFWRSKFEITTADQLSRIRDSGVEAVIIDTARGLSPPPDPAGLRDVLSDEKRHTRPLRSIRTLDTAPQAQRTTGRDRAAAVRRASRTIAKSRAAVTRLFEDARLGNAINPENVVPVVQEIARSVGEDPSIMLSMARLKTKDEYTYLHSVAVCALMINLGRCLNLPEPQIQDLGLAGLLHDVGKMSIPDAILLKPDRLSDDEFSTVRSHPEMGHAILSRAGGVSETALDVCLHHHEKMDGTGYPFRKTGDELSLASRMGAICDVYDAVTSQRPYNTPWSPAHALQRMSKWPGHFDKLLFSSFIQSLGVLPAGTLVRLDNDHLAIVTGEERGASASVARIFQNVNTGIPVVPHDVLIDPGKSPFRIAAIEDPADWGFRDWEGVEARVLTAAAEPARRYGRAG